MKSILPTFSLREKLVLSYLAVALGAMLVLAIVVALVIQNYFVSTQRDQLRSEAEYRAQNIEHLYQSLGGSWGNVPPDMIQADDPVLLLVVDANGQQILYSQPAYLHLSETDVTTLKQGLSQALRGQEVDGQLQGSQNEGGFSGLYICVPLRYNGQANGQIIGAMLVARPQIYPRGFSPGQFLVNVNQGILITGLILAVIVVAFSLTLARSLTHPLAALTTAAEKMKGGDYTQRVDPPRTRDELGQLALTFNAMADTIEADVTELRRQEELRRDLIANIAHDLATPLTAIQGFSEAMADDVITDPAERQETAQLIGREVQRLRRLVGEMQQMSSLEAGRVQFDLAPLDTHALVDETLAVIGPECEQAGITLRNDIPADAPLVRADSDRIIQVFLNLLDNARRHTPAGGKITVNAKSIGKILAIAVSDTGTGIDPADLPHIFERFYRADRSRTASTGGSGLGLSIVKAIITAHGGTIQVQSTPGKGSCITFTLPLAPKLRDISIDLI